MKCEVVTRILLDTNGMHYGEEECGKEAVMRDLDVCMCFTCARAMVAEGDILTAQGTRRFREIERVVASLLS